jgi:hypothetical protein
MQPLWILDRGVCIFSLGCALFSGKKYVDSMQNENIGTSYKDNFSLLIIMTYGRFLHTVVCMIPL